MYDHPQPEVWQCIYVFVSAFVCLIRMLMSKEYLARVAVSWMAVWSGFSLRIQMSDKKNVKIPTDCAGTYLSAKGMLAAEKAIPHHDLTSRNTCTYRHSAYKRLLPAQNCTNNGWWLKRIIYSVKSCVVRNTWQSKHLTLCKLKESTSNRYLWGYHCIRVWLSFCHTPFKISWKIASWTVP